MRNEAKCLIALLLAPALARAENKSEFQQILERLRPYVKLHANPDRIAVGSAN